MKKYSETKAVAQFGQKWKETKYINPSRRNTIASSAMHHLDTFEEMARNIALNRTDKSFSYNINRSLSEENTDCIQPRKLKQNGHQLETFYADKERASDSKKVDLKTIKSPTGKRRSSVAIGRKKSVAVSGDKKESSATVDRRHADLTHVPRYQQSTKNMSSSAADKQKPNKESKCTECTTKCERKCPSFCKNSKETHAIEKNNGKSDHEIDLKGYSIKESKAENCSENSKGVTKQKHENGRLPLLKMSYSEFKLNSDSESSSIVENDTSSDVSLINENTGDQLSPPVLEMEHMKRKLSGGHSASPVRSRVSSGSQTSSLSQRSELSMTSTTSNGSLAEKIIESRALRNRGILRDRDSGSLDSQDFLPPNFSSRRFSMNSEGSREADSMAMYPKGSGNAASYPILNSNRNERNEQTESDSSLQKSKGTLAGSKKHLPDDAPKAGENSIPIRMYKRKQIRKVLEA